MRFFNQQNTTPSLFVKYCHGKKKLYIFASDQRFKVKPQMNINDIVPPCKGQEFEKSIFHYWKMHQEKFTQYCKTLKSNLKIQKFF